MELTESASPFTIEPARPRLWWKRTLLAILAGSALAILATSDTLHGLLIRTLTAAEPIITAHPVWGVTLFVLLSATSAMLAFFSSAVLVPAAVYVWGIPASIALLWLGWILGGLTAYSVGRHLGRQVVNLLTSGRTLAYADKVSAKAPFGFILLFQLALPSEIPGYVLGVVLYDRSKYVLALALAELPYAFATVYLGSSLVEQRTAVLVALGAALAIFSAWAFHILHRRLADHTWESGPDC